MVNINGRQQEDGEERARNGEARDEAQKQGSILAHDLDRFFRQPQHAHPPQPVQPTTPLILHPAQLPSPKAKQSKANSLSGLHEREVPKLFKFLFSHQVLEEEAGNLFCRQMHRPCTRIATRRWGKWELERRLKANRERRKGWRY